MITITAEDLNKTLDIKKEEPSVLEIRRQFEFDPTKPTIILFTGASGAGKDSVLNGLIDVIDENGNVIDTTTDSDPVIHRVLTVTTRDCRNGEEEYAYAFVKIEKKENESDEELSARAKEELGLIEVSAHMGNVYGVPKKGVEEVKKFNLGLIRMEIFGAEKLQTILQNEGFNTIIVSVQAENRESLATRIRGREPDLSEEKIKVRVERAIGEMKKEGEISNVLIRNLNGKLENSRQSLIKFVNYIKTLAGRGV